MRTWLFLAVSASLVAQTPNPTSTAAPNSTQEDVPVFRAEVVARSIQAVNFRVRGGSSKVDFVGTEIARQIKGDGEVDAGRGTVKLDVDLEKIGSPTQYGPEFLTYVLWAITPEGRAENLGEVFVNDDQKAHLDVTTELASFGMIVTAEPYWSVTQPSDVVVAEAVPRGSTKGPKELVNAKYELLPRGIYRFDRSRTNGFRPVVTDKRNPLELFEARNAIQIAKLAGADKYAPDVIARAVENLNRAEDYSRRKQPTNSIRTVSRNAAQIAEDARAITLKRIDEERLANERAAAAAREAEARAAAEQREREARAAQERAAREADERRAAEERARVASQQQQAAEQERLRAEQAKAEAERATAEAQRATAEAQRLKAEAEAARQAALAQQQAAQSDAERARQAASQADALRQKAEQDQANLRAELLRQFSQILETRDTARGLIVNISDVLFDTGKYNLRPAAREKLARLAGIVLAHPGLKLEAEGHTDSVGGEAYNQRLSEQRAEAVQQYLTSQGIRPESIAAKGFGKSMPVASNDNATGRQQNRRVELVISGEVIGTQISNVRTNGGTTAAPAPQQ